MSAEPHNIVIGSDDAGAADRCQNRSWQEENHMARLLRFFARWRAARWATRQGHLQDIARKGPFTIE